MRFSSLGPMSLKSLKESSGDEKPTLVVACPSSPETCPGRRRDGGRGVGLQVGRRDLNLGQLLPGTMA